MRAVAVPKGPSVLHRCAALLALAIGADAHAQSFSEQVVELVNIARWDNGRLPPMKHEALLDASSLGHSTAMGQRNFFMHCDPDTGTSPGQRMTAVGYAWNGWAENIAAGQATPASVMASWMNSAGHRANILGARREIGVGHYDDANDAPGVRFASAGGCTPNTTIGGYRHYWTQNFGSRNGVDPLVVDREAYATTSCEVTLYVYNSIGATEMRFSNDGTNWSAWAPFAADTLWPVAGAAGSFATVRSQIRSGGTVRSAQDSIRLANACGGAGGEPPLFANGME